MITVKTGSDLILLCRFAPGEGSPTSIDGYVINAAVQTSDGLRHMADTINPATLPNVGWVMRFNAQNTKGWAGGKNAEDEKALAHWDAKLFKDGIYSHTATGDLIVLKSITP